MDPQQQQQRQQQRAQQQQQHQQQAVVSPPTPSTVKRPVKFVGSDHDGLPLKRRQVQQACDSCRKKKKRCLHGAATTGFSFIHNNSLSHQHHHQQQQQQRRPQWSPTSQPQQELPPSSSSQQQPNAAPSRPGALLPLSPASTDEASSSATAPSQLVEVSAQRFVGDLSPESVLIEATNRESVELRLQRNRSEVGGWMREAGRAAAAAVVDDDGSGLEPGHHGRGGAGGKARAAGAAAAAAAEEKQPVGAPVTFGGRLQRQQSDHDVVVQRAHHLAVLPPEHEYQQLLMIYLDQNHPILPVIKQSDVLATRWPDSTRQIVFKQGIALVAALEPAASKLLRLDAKGPLLSAEDYHQRLSTAIFASLDANALTDRVDHIRMLLLMFFYYQPRAAAARDFSPLIFSQAVHYALGLGLHLCEYGRGSDDSGNADAECLFCILWALDRLNASFHGRPCYLHHRDTDRELDECIAKQELPAFRLFLGVAKMLDRVIHLYRPRNDGVESVEMPIFESMIIQAGAERVPSRLLSTIEIFYHAVSLLSCRESSASASSPIPASPQPQPPQKHRSSSSSTITSTTTTATTTPTPTTRPSSTAHLPHPTLNARRSLSADRIVDAVLAAPSASPSPPNNPHNNEISLLPFVAYAVALALSVAYQKMRYSRIPMYRSRARARFEEIVALLQRIGAIYTGARVNAALGVLILREMDKTAKTLVGSTSGGASDAAQSNSGGGGEGAVPAAMSVAGSTSQREEEMRRASSVSYSQAPLPAGRQQAQAQGTAAAVADSPQQHQQQQQGVPRRQQYFTSPVAASERVPDDGLLTPFASSSSQSQQGANTPEDISAAMAAPPSWGDLSDIDLFVHFDPGFDLSAVDTALVGNLEMGLPTWMMPWPE